MKITEVDALTREVLKALPLPWKSDVTDAVFVEIEQQARQLSRYQDLVAHFGAQRVNARIGLVVIRLTQRQNCGREHSPKSRLIQTYSRLR